MSWADQGIESELLAFLGKPHLLYLEKRICFLRNGPCSAKFSIRTGQSLIGRSGVANGIPGNIY